MHPLTLPTQLRIAAKVEEKKEEKENWSVSSRVREMGRQLEGQIQCHGSCPKSHLRDAVGHQKATHPPLRELIRLRATQSPNTHIHSYAPGMNKDEQVPRPVVDASNV